MSFTIKTEKDEWIISMGLIVGAPEEHNQVWVAFNKKYDHVQADNLDHLVIAIDQFENPERCE